MITREEMIKKIEERKVKEASPEYQKTAQARYYLKELFKELYDRLDSIDDPEGEYHRTWGDDYDDKIDKIIDCLMGANNEI
jgi:hypothetical protein